RADVPGCPLVLLAGLLADVDAAGDPPVDQPGDRPAVPERLAGGDEVGDRALRGALGRVRPDLTRAAPAGLGVDALDADDPLAALLLDRRLTTLLPGHDGPPSAYIVHT